MHIVLARPDIWIPWWFEKTPKLVNIFCNSKASQELENAEASYYFSDAEFGDRDNQALYKAEEFAFASDLKSSDPK